MNIKDIVMATTDTPQDGDANEIVKALHVLCGFDGKSCSGNCAACPADQFRKQHPSGACDEGTMTAAFALIESQAEKIAELNDFQTSQCAILLAKLNEAERRERAAVEDMKLIVDAVREEHCDETCCFACKFDCDTSITDSGAHACECPGFERDDCFEWRGPQEAGKGEAE